MAQHQAFHSFAQGPSILFVRATMRQDCRFEWTGLPIYFFVRPGLTSPRRYADAAGSEQLGTVLQRNSRWWNVDEQIGLVIRGGNGTIDSNRQVGFNWARTPVYRDQCDAIFVSPRDRIDVAEDDTVIDLTAMIYVGAADKKMAELATAGQSSTSNLDLPGGWQGIIAADTRVPGKRYLAVSNFDSPQLRVPLSLSFAEGGPVLAAESVIAGDKSHVSLKLEPLQSLSEAIELYLQTNKDRPVRAHRTGLGKYVIEPFQESSVVVRCRSQDAETIRVSTNDGRQDRVLSAKERHSLMLTSTTTLTISGPGFLDTTAPSVEITNLDVREDGQMRVDVSAEDQSGIETVNLYCDGQLIAQRSVRPFSFTHFPTAGWHTFYATATDKSEPQNQRVSVKRTMDVVFGKARSNRNRLQN